MNLPEGCYLAYNVMHEAYYAQVLSSSKEISVSASSGGGGCAWEFMVEEVNLGKPCIRVKVFDDAFAAFAQVPEFFSAIADQAPATLAEFVSILNDLGARDETERADRNGDRLPRRSKLPAVLVQRLSDLGWTPPKGGN